MYGLGLAKGLTVTLKNLVMPGRMFTVHQYPDRKASIFDLAKLADTNVVAYAAKQPGMAIKAMIGLASVQDRMPQHSRFRGEEFSWYEDRCTGCASCAKYCPLGIIRIVTSPTEKAIPEGDKFFLEVFDIDMGRCMFCGLCVEACPYDAIHMGSGFEEGKYSRKDLIINKDRLVNSPKRPSTWFRPQMEGKGYKPLDGEDLEWEQAGRHEKPSLEQQEVKWGQR